MPTVRFYAELNNFLPKPARFRERSVPVCEGGTVRTLLASQGVPLDEVDLVLVNGASVGVDQPLRDADRVSVYPVFESFDIGSLQRLRAVPLRVPRFVLDVHLGRLAIFLRMLGVDARYDRSWSDEELKSISQSEHRVLLSRDRALIASPELTRAYLIRPQDPEEQVRQVIDRFQLKECVRPFTRCLRCNTILEEVAPTAIAGWLPEGVRDSYNQFWQCSSCARIFWRGSQYHRMRAVLVRLIADARTPESGPGESRDR